MSAPDLRIEVRDLDMRYGERVIQRDLNFTVRTDDIFVIMGGS
ncbi:MAG: polyamine ABC transporter ATP-binding protein, partial [Candidatus Rokuibacteriota bacterium]